METATNGDTRSPDGITWRVRTSLLLGVIVYLTMAPNLGTQFDDAYISFRYAENLAGGRGLTFNPGERVEGISNLLWTLLLAAARWITGGDMETIALVLNILLTVTALGLICAIECKIFRDTGIGSFEALIFSGLSLLILLGNSNFLILSVNGLEQPLIHVLLLSMVYARVVWADPAAEGFCLFLLACLRLEFTLFILIGGVFDLLTGKSGTARWRTYGLPVLGTLALTVWRYVYFGDIVPNTFYAKTNSETSFIYGLQEAWDFIRHGGFLFFLLPLRIDSPGYSAKWSSYILIYSLYIVVLGRNSLGYFRFYMHILPLVAIVAPCFFLGISSCRGKATAGFVVAVLAASILSPGSYDPFLEARRFSWRAVGNWLKTYTREDALVALNPIGQIGYISGRSILDMLGLTDRTIAKTPITTSADGQISEKRQDGTHFPGAQATTRMIGHEKHNIAYVLTRRPDIVIFRGSLLIPFPTTLDKWRARPNTYEGDKLCDDPDFRRLYVFRQAKIAGAFLPFFLRSDSRALLPEADIVE